MEVTHFLIKFDAWFVMKKMNTIVAKLEHNNLQLNSNNLDSVESRN